MADRDLLVPPGDFIVGRSSDCQLLLDDPLVSRRHAAFRATRDRLTVEDLGSRNGVQLNRASINGTVDLSHGDVVTIGSTDLRVDVVADEASGDEMLRRPTVTMSRNDAKKSTSALALLAGVVDKALAMGRVDEAERILSNVLSETLAGLQNGTREPTALPEATRYALRLAAETGKTTWIDWVFNAHASVVRVIPTTTVDELYTLGRKVKYPVTPALKNYIATLKAESERLGPADRFALQRIDGLVRVLLA
jgi:pSer/pThr/pTyr-binding forkhead associated (FHA) protein